MTALPDGLYITYDRVCMVCSAPFSMCFDETAWMQLPFMIDAIICLECDVCPDCWEGRNVTNEPK